MERWATFDCYGTLVDWNGGIRRELARIFGEDEADAKLAEYHELEPVVEEEEPALAYREVMARVLERLGAPAEERDALGDSLPSWPVFPEVPRALEQARARGWRLCILSNTDRDFIDASMTAIGVPFDRSIVASEIGSYKPAHGHWQHVREGRRPAARRPRGGEPLPRRCADVGARHPLLLDQPARRRQRRLHPGARVADARIPRGGAR